MKKIVLIGYMGSGKSKIGENISKNIGIPFYDLDEIIENVEQDTIKNIFQAKGEVFFRKKESVVFREFLNNNDNFILALGGGTSCYANNHELLNQDGVVSIYLKASIATLVERLSKEKSKRPLIAHLNDAELEDYIRKHLFDRGYYYLQAKHTVAVDNKSVKEISAEIENLLA
ncbi:shikimate kinase [Flavobacterium chuncheonense]|uniref:Shikimate kinase n=1 Tax=Flavobacterium chuncheonense TaxID=2026653 RepID=A0ABW5YIE4_9FLAO